MAVALDAFALRVPFLHVPSLPPTCYACRVDVEFQPSPALAGLLDVLRAAVNGAVPAAPAEWPAVLAQAHAHGVEAYLYPVVRALPADRRPEIGRAHV